MNGVSKWNVPERHSDDTSRRSSKGVLVKGFDIWKDPIGKDIGKWGGMLNRESDARFIVRVIS